MAQVLNKGEIYLNGYYYPILGPVRPRTFNRFPDKMNIGGDSFDQESFRSNWTMNDQREGIGIEEMTDLVKQIRRCWFSTCDLRQVGSILPPPLATEVTLTTLPTITDGDMETWTGNVLDNWAKTGTGTQTKETTVIYSGVASAALSNDGAITLTSAVFPGWSNAFRGKLVSISVWIKGTGSLITLAITDGVGTTTSASVTLDNTWRKLTISRTLDKLATGIQAVIVKASDSSCYVDLCETATVATYSEVHWCNFNSDLWFSINRALFKINHYTGTVSLEGTFPNTITALTSSIGNNLFIFLGDSDNYWYMNSGSDVDVGFDTDEVLDTTETGVTLDGDATTTIPVGSIIKVDSEYMYVSATGTTLTVTRGFLSSPANTHVTNSDVYIIRNVFADAATGGAAHCQNATKGAHWGGYLWKQNAAGLIYYCADPARDDPTFTSNASLATLGLASGSCQELRVVEREDGAMTIGAFTNDGVFLLDTTLANARFLATAITFPSNTTAGKGVAKSPFNQSTYVSSGISVKRFYLGALEGDVGLDKDDGLPAEYDGEIVAMTPGTCEIFALVDASLVTGTAYSSVMRYDRLGWQVAWDAASLNAWVYDFTGSSGTGWSNLASAYDNNTATYATSPSVAAGAWSAYAIYTIGATVSHKLRYYITNPGPINSTDEMEIGVSTDGTNYTTIFSGVIATSAWHTLYFALSSIINARVRFKNTGNSALTYGLAEIQLSEAEIDKTMHACLVSSAYAYRLWFDHNSKIYYQTLQKSLLSPKKVSGYTYAASGMHVMPWFAAGAAAFAKLQKALNAFAKDLTADETIRIMYRINKTYTDLFTGWTDIDTLVAADTGINVESLFASGAGLSYKYIQFAFELSRGSTNTLAPVLTSLTSSFLMRREKVRAWDMTLNLVVQTKSGTPKQLWEFLKLALDAETLLEFTYKDVTDTTETHYVDFLAFGPGWRQSGDFHEGQYPISLVEV